MKKFYKHFTPFIFAVFIFVFTAIPVSAATHVVNPESYDFSISPSSNGDFSVSLDVEDSMYWERYLSGDVRYTNSGTNEWLGESSQEKYLDNIFYKIYPFGKDKFVNFIGVTGAPTFGIQLDISYINDPTVSFVIEFSIGYDLRRPDGAIVTTGEYRTLTKSFVSGQKTYTFELDDDAITLDDTYDPIQVWYILRFKNVTNQESTFKVQYNLVADSNIDFKVNSSYADYLQQILNDKGVADTNNKLDGINGSISDTNDKLDQTNDNLDQIINGDVNPISPSGDHEVNNTMDAEDALLDNAIGNWEESEVVFDNALDSIQYIGSALMAITGVLNKLVPLPFFRYLLYLSLSLGVLSALLNIGESISRGISKSKSRSNKRGK